MNSSQFATSRSELEFFTPTPMTVLSFSAQLRDERREVGVPADDDESVDVRLGIAKVQRVDHHADVGRILSGHAHMRDFDELERRFMHVGFELFVPFQSQ